MTRSRLLSLATALPPHIVPQSQAKAKGRELFGGRKELFDRLASVFDNAGIVQRHTVAPIEWYGGDHGWRDRNRTEGLPRPLYLRGVNVTSPDGTRRTVE